MILLGRGPQKPAAGDPVPIVPPSEDGVLALESCLQQLACQHPRTLGVMPHAQASHSHSCPLTFCWRCIPIDPVG